MHVIVVGGGVFGAAGALELAHRGHRVTLLQDGGDEHPRAASTDISKLVRMDYGADEFYTALMERALEGWHTWNTRWSSALYHHTGVTILAPKIGDGGYEGSSLAVLRRRGHPVQRLEAAEVSARFPAWAASGMEGYVNPNAGWAQSGKVTAALHAWGRDAGVARVDSRYAQLLEQGQRVVGVRDADGHEHRGDRVVPALGAWTARALPEMHHLMWPVAQPVFHFRPIEPSRFEPPAFLPWTADITSTGFYGFALHPTGVLKVAHHGRGIRVNPDDAGVPDDAALDDFRAFFRRALPSLADAPAVARRHCLYCDTWDGNFWIDEHPDRPGLVLATGGSGHGFKFAPVLGELIADATSGVDNPDRDRFRWRARSGWTTEDARQVFAKPQG